MEPLDRLDPLLPHRDAIYESEIFHFLWTALNFVVRGYEFSLVDGAVTIDREFSHDDSFADIFWKIHSASRQLRGGVKEGGGFRLLLFDVKARLSRFSGDTTYITTTRQQSQAAFYLGFCAADPRYVELIPNYCQDPTRYPLLSQQPTREVSVITSKVSRFPPQVYGLDPSTAPYRMPLAYLPKALAQLRGCVRNQETYVNPWTRVPFVQWRPITTTSSDALTPSEDHSHYSGCEAILGLYQQVRYSQKPISLEFIWLQPRIADFKLIIPHTRASDFKQYFIQHKLDGRQRGWGSPLTNVGIVREDDPQSGWYFSHTDRFDFLFYQFSFSSSYTQFFFLPESVLPNSFYSDQEREVSFERDEFRPFRVHLDNTGRWIDRILEIIRQHPSPRQTAARPIRSTAEDPIKQPELTVQPAKQTQPASAQTKKRKEYSQMVQEKHRIFYRRIMDECCRSHRGLLVVLEKDHPLGDFAMCDLRWSQEEVTMYWENGKPPRTLDDLPADMPMVTLYYFARGIHYTASGPTFTAPQFRRLNGCRGNRLIIWDIWASDEGNPSYPLIVIPSEDVGPSAAQRSIYQRNLERDKKKSREETSPRLPYLLRDGHLTSDYVVGRRGPDAYDGDLWSAIWFLGWKFTQCSSIEHPAGCFRRPQFYRVPLRRVHERLVVEQNQPSMYLSEA